MKKILTILAGVLALAATSCVKETLTMFDPSKATAPVLNSYNEEEDAIVASYTPAVFKQGFNEKIAPYHSLALVSLDGKAVSKTLTSSDKDGVLTLKKANLAKALMTLGAAEGSTVSLELAVRASMQEVSKDNGRNGYVDSQGRIALSSFEVVIPEVIGSPYAEYTENSDWSVIGALSAYEINWDGDLNMWTDGSNHVAAHVTLKAGDEFKFRKDQGWDVNLGGDFGGLDNEFAVSQDGPNIKVGADGVYDLFVNPTAGVAWISAAYDPLPDFTESSNWSVIGALSLNGISWDGDIAMISNGTWHVALGVNLAAADEFKFRQDAAWTVNMGGDFGALGEEFEVTQDGPNIKVGADGCFDLYVNPDAGVAKVTEASGAKVSGKIGGGEEPPVVQVTGWNIIGLNGDWENDILATEDNGVWTAYITAEGDTEFKWRKDAGWDENYGGTFVELGRPFEAVAGGDNIKIGAGFWKVVLDTNNLTITIDNGQVWSLIGDFNEWGGDVDMTLTDGKWVSPVTKISGKFKIRENHGWDNNRGGVFVTIGEPFAAVAGGDDIAVEEGNYVVTYDPTAETIVIDETGWGVVGTITGWGNSPDIILKEEGLFLVARNISMTADDKIKIRYKSDWDVNRGGASSVGHAVKAVPGGDDIAPGVAGNFDVWYRPDSEVIFVMPSGSLLTYWGVVGTINGWGAPDRIMYEQDGKFIYEDLELKASDAVKIRLNEEWTDNRGGVFADLGQAFAVENGGPDITVGRDAKVTVIYDPSAETITFDGVYEGDAPDFPDYIYAIGGDTGWSGVYPLFGKNGQYKGFGYLSQEFKFRPYEDKWDGDWECVGEGQIGQGSDNCPAPEAKDAGYYMIEVDLNAMTYSITRILSIGIIGPAQAGGWDTDTDMTYNQEGGYWEAKGVTLSANLMKFRANDGWDINWGGSFDNLVQGGDNMAVEAGTYDVVLYALCDGKAHATLTPAGGDQPAAGITIDGDMSDWANIEGVSDGNYGMFKAASDDQYLYFYAWRNTGGRYTDIWGERQGYIYLGFDLDGDETNGEELWGNGPYDFVGVIYPYAGSAAAPAFSENPGDACAPSNYTLANVFCKGVADENGAYVEFRIPRADLPTIPNAPITIKSWGNKDLTKVTLTCTL